MQSSNLVCPARRKEQPWTLFLQKLAALQAATVRIGDKVDHLAFVVLFNGVDNLTKLLAQSGTVFSMGSRINELERIRFEVDISAHSVDRVPLLTFPPISSRPQR